jgi:hypothetical protein
MTRAEFIARATRAAEQEMGVPAGWWGMYRDVRGPNGTRVHWSSNAWTIRDSDGKMVSRHDSRQFAIRKAVRLDKSRPRLT